MSVGAEQPGSPVKHQPGITILPTTDLGRWAVGLAAAFFPLVFAAGVVPLGAALGFFCGLAGGAAALTAVIRDRERAVTVFAALLPLVVGVAFVLAEVITGNP
jgi:hypothetical protein